MNISRFRSAASVIVSLGGLILVAGCVADYGPRKEPFNNQQFQTLYPRQYYDSASPAERQDLDQQQEILSRQSNRR